MLKSYLEIQNNSWNGPDGHSWEADLVDWTQTEISFSMCNVLKGDTKSSQIYRDRHQNGGGHRQKEIGAGEGFYLFVSMSTKFELEKMKNSRDGL